MNPVETNRDATGREIVVSRFFDAPRERVWAAWTDPEQIVRWWGPRGFRTTIHEMDVREGGDWRHTMHGPDGVDYPNHTRFVEVLEPRRIVYTNTGGAEGGPTTSFVGTWTFEEEGGGTRLTMRLAFDSAEDRDVAVRYGALEGGEQTLARLAEVVESRAEGDAA